MAWVSPMTMKLVVMGTPGLSSRRTSFSARRWSRRASEEKRRKSSSWLGLFSLAARRGGRTWSQSEYRCAQKAVPQASLRVGRSP